MLKSTLSVLGAAAMCGVFVVSSDATAQVVTNGLVLQLDANDIDGDGTSEGAGEGGVVAGLVNTWMDASGNGNAIDNSVSGSSPSFVAGGINGLPVVRFNGTSNYLTRNDALGFSGSPAVTTFIVASDTAASGGTEDRLLTFGADAIGEASGDQVYGFSNDSSWRYNAGNRVFANDPIIDGTGEAHLGIWRGEAGDLHGDREFFLDGLTAALETGATNAGSASNLLDEALAVGASWFNNNGDINAPAEFLDADIAEILVYDRALTDEELNQVGFYLQDKWGIDAQFTAPPAVPEPASVAIWSMLGLGLVGFGYYRARRKG